MKRVLITGANSYVGTNVEKWLMKEPENFYVETLDMRDPNWKNYDFSKFDVVFHVAGIAHIKETKKNRELYYKVNRDLAVETAIKAKISGIKHFIFMSTMSIFGLDSGIIDDKTIIKPKSAYGISKHNAEIIINGIVDQDFGVTILRPPMIYGPKTPGNYAQLSRTVKKIRVFPNINNKRSFIYIEHFCEFVKYVILTSIQGTFHPQNKYLLGTKDLIFQISKQSGIKIHFSNILKLISVFKFSRIVRKVFGSLYYDDSIYTSVERTIVDKATLYSFEETIRRTESNRDL